MTKKMILAVVGMMMALGLFAYETWTDLKTGIVWKYSDSGEGVTVCGVATYVVGDLTIPSVINSNDVKCIGHAAFSPNNSLTSVTIPEGVTRISDLAFSGCYYLERVKIPTSVTRIGAYAFAMCPHLTKITIPEGVSSIEWLAFGYCGRLVEILVASNNSHYVSENGTLFNKAKTEIVAYPAGKCENHFTIPSGVMSIGDGAFGGCCNLTSVTIPEGVTSIGDGAFTGCSYLTSLMIPDSVTDIGCSAFEDCGSLRSITIPSSVMRIGMGAFEMSDGLASIDFEGLPPGGIAVAEINIDAKIRYNIAYESEWLLVIEECGFTNAMPYNPKSSSKPTPSSDPDPIKPEYDEPEEPLPTDAFDGSSAHTYNGLVYDSGVMCGMVQLTTTKESTKGVKVSGFVILSDGKKQTIKAVTAQVSGGYLNVSTIVGKIGNLAVTLGGNGFTGTLGDMTVASADVDENTGIMSATVKVQYFDAKTGKLKSKSYKMSGVTSGGEAVGTATLKNEVKTFEAVIE